MARITVEDCLEKIDNRFKLIHLAAKRVRLLRKGEEPQVDSKNTDIVVSLREIAAGKVFEVEGGRDQYALIEDTEDHETIPEYAAEGSPSDEITDREDISSAEE